MGQRAANETEHMSAMGKERGKAASEWNLPTKTMGDLFSPKARPQLF
jgi:hypothetical protein